MAGKQDNLEDLDRIVEVNLPVGRRVFVGTNCILKELHSRDLFSRIHAQVSQWTFPAENQGVQGTDFYLDMQRLPQGTNGIGAWGVNLFIPHAFDST